MAGKTKSKHLLLHPITLRLTFLHMERLNRLCAATGLPQQDHIRRALDVYFDVQEAELHALAENMGLSQDKPSPHN